MQKHSVLFALFALLFVGCTTKQLLGERVYLTSKEAKGHIDSPFNEFKGVRFFEVEVNQLDSLRMAHTLTYLGTDSTYHFMRTWNKLSYPEEIGFAVVRVSACQVEDIRTVPMEVSYRPEQYGYHPWRPVEVSGDGCRVKRWEKGARTVPEEK